MKILLTDNQKIFRFELPSQDEDAYLVNYEDEDENKVILNFEHNKEQWYLQKNNQVSIKNVGDSIVTSVPLSDHFSTALEICGKPKLLYCEPSVDNNLYNLELNNLTEITIGSEANCKIIFPINNTLGQHALIKQQAGTNTWYIESLNGGVVFVNDEAIYHSNLKTGDVIFINGLKIIWMTNFLRLNNPNHKITINGLLGYKQTLQDNTHFAPNTEEENNVKLYKEGDYFYHTPRLIRVMEEQSIKIDDPPTQVETEKVPIILTLGTSLTMSIYSIVNLYTVITNISNGTKTLKESLTQIVLCVSMIVGSLILPRITEAYRNSKNKKKEKKRQEKYKAYLKEKEEKIQAIMKEQSQVLANDNKNLMELVDIIMNKTISLWEREIPDDDFLRIRLGTGSIPPKIKIAFAEEHFTLEEDNLKKMVYEIVDRNSYLKNVPITLSLTDKNVVGIVYQCSYIKEYIDGLILQLMALHSGLDLKIVVITDKKSSFKWDYLKKLPHCWSDDREVRFFSTNAEDTKEIMSYLEKDYQSRIEKMKNNKDTQKKIADYHDFESYYLILTDNYKAIKDSTIINTILSSEANMGYTLLAVGKTVKNLPARCETFVQLEEKEGCVLEKNYNSSSQNIFSVEYSQAIPMDDISTKIASIPVTTKDANSVLPNSLTFLEMYNVAKIEHLSILNRWQTNNPVTSLSVPIGVHSNSEAFKLDLHEKFHGPHGLIAGSTGSGKSEFIITYMLSLAVNYHPYEVQFVLIDYKGGGLAGAFENKETGVRLPHLTGTITNLDTSEMKRTLVSIESEMKRRQKKFNEVRDNLGEGTIDIYKYQRLYREGLINEPMSHLFIISDEFAELKQQQPDFMQQLISTARIGRSLGIHLILATQKPAGVVNDQIWSNSKFKVCLKVQDRSDSMEMLKKPDAASIKEAGRFYLQVGYDDYYDIGQSGWSGAKYVPSDVIITKIDDSINFVNDVGSIYKTINDVPTKKESNVELGDQLTNIVKYISNLAIKENIKTKKLWLDPIPAEIYVNDLIRKYNYVPVQKVISPVIGEYDNPKEQQQGLLNLNITKNGNVLIYGQNGSGKENLLTTIIWSTIVEHHPQEVNFYIVDCGSESLKVFNKMPHVGDVVTIDDGDKLVDLFNMINEELEHRRDLFADYGGSFVNYIENGGANLPLIIIAINSYDVFQETFPKYDEGIQSFIRDGSKYGIDFIITAISTSAVRSRTAQLFGNKIALQLPNEADYRNVMNAPRGLSPAKFFGRGLIEKDDTAYEFQTANICNKKDVIMTIKNAAIKLSEAYSIKAKRIPSVPEYAVANLVESEMNGLMKVPIGYSMEKKEIFCYDFANKKFNLVLAENIEDHMSFIYGLVYLLKKVPNTKLKVIDIIKLWEHKQENVEVFNENFETIFANLNNSIMQTISSEEKYIYIMIGTGQARNVASSVITKILGNIFSKEDKLINYTFIFVDSYTSHKNLQIEPWYQEVVDSTSGIWLGENIASQMAINFSNISVEERKIVYPDIGIAVVNGKHTFIKHIVDMKGEETNEE